MKGQIDPEPNLLVVAILMVVGLLAIITVIIGSRHITDEQIADQDCRTSIDQYLATASLTGNYDVGQIHCKTRVVRITTKDETLVKKQVAEQMRKCWATWKEGKRELFSEPGTYCHVCSIIKTSSTTRPAEGLTSYLVHTPAPFTNVTYADYLMGYETEEVAKYYDPFAAQYETRADDAILPGKKYVVLFAYAKGENAIAKLQAASGGKYLFSAGVGLVGGAAAVGGTAYLFGPPGWVVGTVIFIGIGAVSAFAAYNSADIQWMSIIFLRPYDATEIAALGCQFSPAEQDMFGKM